MAQDKIYAVKRAGADDYTSIALHLEVRDGAFNGLCFLTPPDRGHMIPGKVKKETPDGFVFTSTGYAPGDWTFTDVTLDNFRDEYHALAVGGAGIADSMATTEELRQWFNDHFPI